MDCTQVDWRLSRSGIRLTIPFQYLLYTSRAGSPNRHQNSPKRCTPPSSRPPPQPSTLPRARPRRHAERDRHCGPVNNAWYELMLHHQATAIWDTIGRMGLRRLFDRFHPAALVEDLRSTLDEVNTASVQ